MILVQAEPLLNWTEPVTEYIGFVAQFLAVGAVGFRYAAVRGRLRGPDGVFYADACARAARLGLIGALAWAALFATGLPTVAARAHTTVWGLLTSNVVSGLTALLLAIGVLGLALAAVRRAGAWPLAAAGLVLAPLTGIVTGKWSRLVNPVHRLVAGLWIGTLLVLVLAGLTLVLRDARMRERRGTIAADMVNGFSPLALSCGMIVVLSGLITAWTHLNPLSSLWTTPYGWALLVKLAFAAVVFALGAWNWRRVGPTLGSDSAAVAIRRSSTGELVAAALVLAATAVVVSLPSPKPPRPAGPPAPGAAPAASAPPSGG
jgi:putative copper export protein